MYKIILKKQADKYLKLLNRDIQLKILTKLKILEQGKFEFLKVSKLEGFESLYKFRIWKYRIIFEKNDNKLIILIVKIWARGDVYKWF